MTDKLKSYDKPIKFMYTNTEHPSHKGLNNRVENAHQPTLRCERWLHKFKSSKGTQVLLSLMGKVRNIFAIGVNRYKQMAEVRRQDFKEAQEIWLDGASQLLCI